MRRNTRAQRSGRRRYEIKVTRTITPDGPVHWTGAGVTVISAEAKGFEATGRKLTDFLGDIRKIIDAKESRTCFFVVTDGRGWMHRNSDLQHMINHQHLKDIDMIYTSARLAQLAKDIAYIWQHERRAFGITRDRKRNATAPRVLARPRRFRWTTTI